MTLKRIISFALIIMALVFSVSCGNSEADGPDFVRGTVINNVYESRFAGIKFSPGPSWTFASDEEILSKNGIETAGMTEEEILEKLSGSETVYDMIAGNGATGINVVILFDKYIARLGDDITSDEYMEKLKTDLETKYSDSGAEVTTGSNAVIGGAEFYCVEVLQPRDSGDVKQIYYVRNTGEYFMTVCITAPADKNINSEVLEKFDPSGKTE